MPRKSYLLSGPIKHGWSEVRDCSGGDRAIRSVDLQRLATIRNERKPNSRYSSIKQCMHEIEEIELMYRRERIPYLNTTAYSVEEISTRIMVTTGLKRQR